MNAHPFPSLLSATEADYLLLTEGLRRRRLRPTLMIAVAAGLAAPALALLAPVFGSSGNLTLAQWAVGANAAPDLEIVLPPPLPMELVEATRGEQAAMAATGDAAQVINASLPFSTAPLEAARPFVIPAASMSAQDRALHCLTQAVYYEAGFEPADGRRAVAQVVLNRVRHPAFPNSVCGVVYDGASRRGCQFSFTCDGSLRRPPAPAAWAEAARIAREALRGQVASTVGLATHYHANYVAPYWAPRLTKLRQIGAHIFYRWPGAWGRTAAFSSPYSGSESLFIPAASTSAETALPIDTLPVDPTDRRAPEDVGGRLDVTKGWILSIPSPSDSRGRIASVLGRQQSSAVAQPTSETQTLSQ